MTKEEWVEFFEAVNGRIPTAQEFQEAREKGEFSINVESIKKLMIQKKQTTWFRNQHLWSVQNVIVQMKMVQYFVLTVVQKWTEQGC